MTDDPSLRERLRPAINDHEFLSWLGLELKVAEPGSVTLWLPADDRFSNVVHGSRGNVHGGIVATLIDVGCGLTLRTTFDDPADAKLATTDLSVSYVRPARSGLKVEGSVIRSGRSIGFATADVIGTNPDGEPVTVAHGKASFHIFE